MAGVPENRSLLEASLVPARPGAEAFRRLFWVCIGYVSVDKTPLANEPAGPMGQYSVQVYSITQYWSCRSGSPAGSLEGGRVAGRDEVSRGLARDPRAHPSLHVVVFTDDEMKRKTR